MKLTKTIMVATLLVGGLLAGSSAVFAQGGPGGGGPGGGGPGGGRGGMRILTQDQTQQMRDAATAETGLTDLNTKLQAAQKDVVDAALAPNATEASVKAKLQVVASIQTDIAVLRFTKVVKPVVSTITADQKTQIDATPMAAAGVYAQFFGGGGGFGGRGGRGGFGGGGGGGN